jgi:hypothetical protein
VEEAIGEKVTFPERLLESMEKEGRSVEIDNTLDSLKAFLLQRY